MQALSVRHNEPGSISVSPTHGQHVTLLVQLQNRNGDIETEYEVRIDSGQLLHVKALDQPVPDVPS